MLKKIGIIIGVVVGLLIVAAIVISIIAKPHFERYQAKSKQVEAKSLLAAAYTSMKMGQAEFGSYRQEDLDLFLGDVGGQAQFFSVSASHPKCPDCGITAEGFKLVAVGNIDDDPDEDVWTMDQDKNLENIQSDFTQ